MIAENTLAVLIEDKYAVTRGHSLAIPTRHVVDYFDLHQPERNALESLLKARRLQLMEGDKSVLGFNLGVNSGATAGQTVMHVHIHLIPRIQCDVDDPRGGIRHLMPGKGYYADT